MKDRWQDGTKEFFKMFDHIYVINRKVDTSRLANIKEQLDAKCEYEIFEATDGWKDSVPQVINEENINYEGWTVGAAGLVDTTIRILEDAKAKEYDKILILEDDIVFNNSLFHVTRYIPDDLDWDLFHFACKDYKRPKRFGKLKILAGAWSCQIYGVNSKIYDEYLTELHKRDKPIDLITSGVFHPQGRSYAPRINMIDTLPNISAIRNKFVNY